MKRRGLLAVASVIAVGAAGAGLVGMGALVAAPSPAAAADDACSRLAAPGLFDNTTVASARTVAADAAKGLPAYCEVTAVVSPVAGSRIGVVYRLPEGWNGKMLGLGGGGWAGNLRIESAAPGLKAGYATAQTDGGHESTNPWDTAWASNPEAITDFAHRAIHLMTVTGKKVVDRHYGKAAGKSYFHGCSTGGRQGLMEVQRYPDDYDAVISQAPVYNLTVQTSAVVRSNTFAQPGAGFTAELLEKVNAAVLKACDAQDGLADGLLADPRACNWDPASMQCPAGAAGADCLSAPQVAALRTSYSGVQTIDGRVAAWPLARGGEALWSRFVGVNGPQGDATNGGGLGGLRGPILGDPAFDLGKFDPARDLARVRSSAFAQQYEASDPAISRFIARGGKLLLWHGWSDPGPSPMATITYYQQVQGAVPAAADSVRLFLGPGVGHCAGGPGPDQSEYVAVLDRWVQTGQAPEILTATKATPRMSRPLCAFPKVARYKGSGDTEAASSYTCG